MILLPCHKMFSKQKRPKMYSTDKFEFSLQILAKFNSTAELNFTAEYQ